ncbi:unnamed protein product [Meganyctiphanes norvegica]|uniref:Adhesion G protein-coupled receptor A3 n=1 Tax=Meganyctiphanes norvegica TaxID=48144 RepID=A0AAV2PJS7_MEGNR
MRIPLPLGSKTINHHPPPSSPSHGPTPRQLLLLLLFLVLNHVKQCHSQQGGLQDDQDSTMAPDPATLSNTDSNRSHGGGGAAHTPSFTSPSTTTPSTVPPCPEDLCKHSELKESVVEGPPPGGVLGPPIKVSCHNDLRITHVNDVFACPMPPRTIHLDLSESGLTRLPAGAFSHLPYLEKLDLKKNDISQIEPGAFLNLTNLRRLDLTGNKIISLNGSQLTGLTSLIKLKIGKNPLARIQEGIMNEAKSLKSIDLSDTSLVCDCALAWLVAEPTKRSRPPRVNQSARCARPQRLSDMTLKKLRPDQLTCQGPGDSMVELEPHLDQVVFAGDSLRLRCRVTSAEESPRVHWARGDEHIIPRNPNHPTDNPFFMHSPHHQPPPGAKVKTTYLPDAIESMVEIGSLSDNHSGEWSCLVQGRQGNHTQTVSIYVIAHDTNYCPINVTQDNRGMYWWPRTVAGVPVELPCFSSRPTINSRQRGAVSRGLVLPMLNNPQAIHFCSEDGTWKSLDTSRCPFVSETTKILERFAATILTSSKTTNLRESSRTLRNFTKDGKQFHDSVDLVFLAQTIDHYQGFLGATKDPIETRETADFLVDIISAASLNKELLESAERLNRSSHSLLSSLWSVTDKATKLTRSSATHIQVYQANKTAESFSGLTCSWYRRSLHSTERDFRCNAYNYSRYYSTEDEILDAQIEVPSGVLKYELPKVVNTSEEEGELAIGNPVAAMLQFFVYDTSNLFPRIVESHDSWEVTSPVIGVRIKGQDEHTVLEDQVNVMVTLRSAIYSHNIVPVWWKHNSTNGHGKWMKEGCKVVSMHNSLIVFRCNRLGHFGLLQDMAILHRNRLGERGAEFRPSAPGVYVGSGICIVFLMASILTWAAHHHNINTMSKNKHSFVNTWVALLLLVTLFTAGVYQTENPLLCQGVGVALHYLTTCVLLWIIVTVTNLYKKVTKALRPPMPPEEPPPDIPLPPKPMLRFYLVGWGIALILCGISAAVNMQNYAGYSYCFLAWGPSLGAFFAPSALFVFILSVVFLLTQCVLRSGRTVYSEAGGATETTELELLDANSPGSENAQGMGDDELSLASQDTTVSITDGQHSPLTQLRAHVVTLLLFILTWASAAITTAEPFGSVIPYQVTIFSVIYAVCASSLGIFIFVFFCVSRSDVCDAWRDCRCNLTRLGKEEEETQLTIPANNSLATASNLSSVPVNNANQNLSSINQSVSLNHNPVPITAPSTQSLDSSNTHQTNKSSSLSQSILTGSNKPESLGKGPNNLQLLTLGNMGNDLQYAPEIFYNPKQVGVAKRFFQKQRLRQMVKHNNLGLHNTDSDCNSTVYKPRIPRSNNSESEKSNNFDPSCLGASSKVNNTNIHVDAMAYMYLPTDIQIAQMSVSKHANKEPTPEVLCVLGPGGKVPGYYNYQVHHQQQQQLERVERDTRGWSTIPRKPRAFMEEPLSPVRRSGSFPSVIEEQQDNGTSQTTSQSSALEQLSFIPRPQPPAQALPAHERLPTYPIHTAHNPGIVQPQQQEGMQYHNPVLQQHSHENTGMKRSNHRNSFNSDLTERSDDTGVSHNTEKSRSGRHSKNRTARDRTRAGRPRRKHSRPRARDDKDDWSDDNTSPIIINHLPSTNCAPSTDSDKDMPPHHHFIPFPQRVQQVASPRTQQAVLQNIQNSIDSLNSAINAEIPDDLHVELNWPHVLGQGTVSGNTKSKSPQCPNSYSPDLNESEEPNFCYGGDGGSMGWESEECGSGYWCEGGGEERIKVCEVSGCDNSSLCGGDCGTASDLCGGGNSSEGGTSVDPVVGTSPRGSVNISDSPYDSPLHRYHHNTPDTCSLDSVPRGSLDSAPPVSPSQASSSLFEQDLTMPYHSTPSKGIPNNIHYTSPQDLICLAGTNLGLSITPDDSINLKPCYSPRSPDNSASSVTVTPRLEYTVGSPTVTPRADYSEDSSQGTPRNNYNIDCNTPSQRIESPVYYEENIADSSGNALHHIMNSSAETVVRSEVGKDVFGEDFVSPLNISVGNMNGIEEEDNIVGSGDENVGNDSDENKLGDVCDNVSNREKCDLNVIEEDISDIREGTCKVVNNLVVKPSTEDNHALEFTKNINEVDSGHECSQESSPKRETCV